jgi:hypothetical protein
MILRIMVCLFILCMVFLGICGCSAPASQQDVPKHPVFSNGTEITGGNWISLDPIGNQKASVPFRISGMTNLQPGTVLDVIIIKSPGGADKIKSIDDCMGTTQTCLFYLVKVGDRQGDNTQWNVMTDNSLQDYLGGNPLLRVIVVPYMGDISVRQDISIQ